MQQLWVKNGFGESLGTNRLLIVFFNPTFCINIFVCYIMNAVSVDLTWCLGRWGTVGGSDSLVVNVGSSGTGSNSPATQTCTPPPAAPSTCFVIDLRGQITERERDNEKRMSGIQDCSTPVFGFAHVKVCLMSSWPSIPGPMCWKHSLWKLYSTCRSRKRYKDNSISQNVYYIQIYFYHLLLIWTGWYCKQEIFKDHCWKLKWQITTSVA